jgi:hypothetical protein
MWSKIIPSGRYVPHERRWGRTASMGPHRHPPDLPQYGAILMTADDLLLQQLCAMSHTIEMWDWMFTEECEDYLHSLDIAIGERITDYKWAWFELHELPWVAFGCYLCEEFWDRNMVCPKCPMNRCEGNDPLSWHERPTQFHEALRERWDELAERWE